MGDERAWEVYGGNDCGCADVPEKGSDTERAPIFNLRAAKNPTGDGRKRHEDEYRQDAARAVHGDNGPYKCRAENHE